MHQKNNVPQPVRAHSCSSPVTTLSPELRMIYPQVPMISFQFFLTCNLHNSCPDLCTWKLQNYCIVLLLLEFIFFFRFLELNYKEKHLPPAIVSNWQGRWRMVSFTRSITVGYLFQFQLSWRNRSQTDDMWIFCIIKEN